MSGPRIVCAPDSFKHSLGAAAAASALARGVRAARPDATVVEVPLSDGGEGFLAALTAALGAQTVAVPVLDALGRPRPARLARAGDLAVIEVAAAVGLADLADDERDVLHADTRGVGQLVRAALDAGCRRLLVGLGGSATTDGGAGMLAALGVRFLDDAGQDLATTPAGLARLARVDADGLDPRLAACRIDVACDVDAPLTGPRGAAAVFGPQKGATPAQVGVLDGVLARLAELSPDPAGAQRPGAGAAGGLGFALTTFLGARLTGGLALVADAVGLEGHLAGADLVLTGEGAVDAQTLAGKVPAGVAALARAHGVEVWVLAGRVDPGAEALLDAGVTALIPITAPGQSPADALAAAAQNLERAAAVHLRAWSGGAGAGR